LFEVIIGMFNIRHRYEESHDCRR